MAFQEAKAHPLDLPRVTSIEYPLNVRNVDKVIQMTGGKKAIFEKIMNREPLELRLRPEDPFQHPIEGKLVYADNILIKISVSKKELEEKHNGDLQLYLKAVREQNQAIMEKKESESPPEKRSLLHVTPVGIVNRTYRFREMTDYQYIVRNSKFAQQVDKGIFQGNLDEIKKIDFSLGKYPWSAHDEPRKDEDLDLPPPPIFSNQKIPAMYNYRQNEKLLATTIPGTSEKRLVPTQKSKKLYSIVQPWTDKETPQEPHPRLKIEWNTWKETVKAAVEKFNETSLTDLDVDYSEIFPESPYPMGFCYSKIPEPITKMMMKENDYRVALRHMQCVEVLNKLFEKEDIYSKKGIMLELPKELRKVLRFCLPYVAYSFRQGPWRSTYIKFGVDPRTDAKYRFYQHEFFRLVGLQSSTLNAETYNKFLNDDRILKEEKRRLLEFWGDFLPKLISFLIKELRDPDVQTIFELNKDTPLNSQPDLLGGWFPERVILALRELVRFKLSKLYRNKPIPRNTVDKIIDNSLLDKKTDKFTIKEEGDAEFQGNDEGNLDDDMVDEEEEDDDDDEGEETKNGQDIMDVDEDPQADNSLLFNGNEDDLLLNLKKTNPKNYEAVKNLVGIIKQDDLLK